MGTFLLAFLFLAVAGLAWWQFIRSLTSRKAKIKGWVFERDVEPFHYWTNTIMFGIGGLMTSALGSFLLLALLVG
jgi:hypothetical protein